MPIHNPDLLRGLLPDRRQRCFRKASTGLITAVGMGLLSILPLSPCSAGSNANAKILVHLVHPSAKNPCSEPRAGAACYSLITQGLLYPNVYYAFLIVADGSAASGVAGLDCGIEYNNAPQQGVDIFLWQTCNEYVGIPTNGWPASGGGMILAWGPSQFCHRNEPGGPGTGVVAAMGHFYCAAYTPDILRVTTRHRVVNVCALPDLQEAAVASCDYQVDRIAGQIFNSADCSIVEINPTPYPLGFVAFSQDGLARGSNPCDDAIPVVTTTWSAIKNQFKEPN